MDVSAANTSTGYFVDFTIIVVSQSHNAPVEPEKKCWAGMLWKGVKVDIEVGQGGSRGESFVGVHGISPFRFGVVFLHPWITGRGGGFSPKEEIFWKPADDPLIFSPPLR